ncbi:MAG TPA: envelope stress response membrane protein PspB [Allosphingosinicella sp.]|jgi:phage shock protein B|nr:envelope stress response membrane protein PspB [Allosphingosinicella sp.]
MEDVLIPIIVVPVLFIALPWIILHYVSKWKTAATLTTEDENLLDELHDLARRLDERMCTIERIVQAENPNWRQLACDPVETALEDRSTRILEQERATRATTRRNR